MIALRDVLPDSLLESLGPAVSVLCVRTAQPKYLVFGADDTAPAYVLQIGDKQPLTNMFELTRRLHGLLPTRIAEPLALVPHGSGEAILVQRGLAGLPWFTLQRRIRSGRSWNRVRDISLDALLDLQTASAMQSDWTEQIDLGSLFERIRQRHQKVCGEPTTEQRRVLDARQRDLADLGVIDCFRQHGDFCVNNLLFRQNDAAIVDFEQFGRVMQPLHDEFLLTGSLLALHPQYDLKIATSLWSDLVQRGRYPHLTDGPAVDGLFLMHLMWWISESGGQELRKQKRQAYARSLDQTFERFHTGTPWTADLTVL